MLGNYCPRDSKSSYPCNYSSYKAKVVTGKTVWHLWLVIVWNPFPKNFYTKRKGPITLGKLKLSLWLINKLYNLSTDNTFGTLQVKNNIYALTFVCICVFNSYNLLSMSPQNCLHSLWNKSPLKSILFSVTSHTVEAFLSEW